MMLQFDYDMQLTYSAPIHMCHFTIKCLPKNTCRQRLVSKELSLTPPVVYSEGEDSYGNGTIYGHVPQPHDFFEFHIKGQVEILPIDYEEEVQPGRLGMYKYPSGKCIAGPNIKKYFDSLKLDLQKNPFDLAMSIMERLHQNFSYVPSTTQVETDAEAALSQGTGVCQDYAHIFITLLRLAGIPARYVCGLLVGEGASHAWVEAAIDGKWIGMDPTNNCLVKDSHIKLGDGRDATECAINRGIMRGNCAQSQKVTALVSQQ